MDYSEYRYCRREREREPKLKLKREREPRRGRKLRRRRGAARVLVFLVLMLGLLLAVSLYLERQVNPMVYAAVSTKISANAHAAFNSSAQAVIVQNPEFERLTEVKTDSTGKVTYIEYNQALINLYALRTVSAFLSKLEAQGRGGVDIALGSFSGIAVLSAYGPNISIRYQPVSMADCKINTEFISAGINQTAHRITFNVSVLVQTMVPGDKQDVKLSCSIVAAEAIIVGDVPSVFFGSQNIGNLIV